MRVRILHNGLLVDGVVRAEGEELETSNPYVVAFALGLKTLTQDRLTMRGFRVPGDKRGAEALSEATEAEVEAAKGVSVPTEPSPLYWRRQRNRHPQLDVATIKAIAKEVAAETAKAIIGAKLSRA